MSIKQEFSAAFARIEPVLKIPCHSSEAHRYGVRERWSRPKSLVLSATKILEMTRRFFPAPGGLILLLVRSPGARKTLFACAMPGILPQMSIEDSPGVTRMYSVAEQGTP